MTPLPWTPGPAANSFRDEDATMSEKRPSDDERAEQVVLASQLRLRRFRDIPGFLSAALDLRRRFRTAPGGVGLALHAQPARRTFWTLSAWVDHDALHAYTADAAHVAVMNRHRPHMAGSVFVTWTQPAGPTPTWPDARRRLAHHIASTAQPPPIRSTAPDPQAMEADDADR